MPRQHYWEATLTTPDLTKRWSEKGATEKEARVKVKAKAKKAGEDPDKLFLDARRFTGPAPRTFKGKRL